MRWSGQELTAEEPSALPGLARLSNLVRSVRTPEFAGITFHEVMAKSALNRVPSASDMPFGWTINPYRGCSHACVYCLDPETPILMADGRQKPLRQVEVGDSIYGTELRGEERRYVITTVHATWGTRKRGHRVTLADGTRLIASGDHRFLTDHGWEYVTGAASGSGGRPHLATMSRLAGVGLLGSPPLEGAAVVSSAGLDVVSVDDLGAELDMIDITTGTGDFIAGGVVSHNCFARRTHEYLDLDAGKDFDSEIVVKVNVAEVLRRELSRPGWGRHPVALGTNTDPYQRAEGRYRLMPGIVAALADSGTPFSVLTKGTLLRRDLPLLAEAATVVPVGLALSIAIYDDDLQQSVEPGTPSTAARLATVAAARELGLDCEVFMMPILPYLTDTRDHLERALSQIREAGATSVLYSALHLRPGAKEWFMLWLEREHPELVDRYREMYGSSAYAPIGYRRWLSAKIAPMVRRYGLRHGDPDPATGTVRSTALARGRAGSLDLIQAELPAAGPPPLF